MSLCIKALDHLSVVQLGYLAPGGSICVFRAIPKADSGAI